LCFYFPAINGFLFSNLPRLDMCKGDTVAWHLLGLGTETDVHGVMFEGNTVQLQGMRKGAVMLFPHTFVTAIMQPDNPGKCISSRPKTYRLRYVGDRNDRGGGRAGEKKEVCSGF
jgi:hypothetical protein